jgi:HK97 family phage major capsid protein
MTIEEIEARLSSIKTELDSPEADLDALQSEVRELTAQRDELRNAAKADAEKRAAIAEGLGEVTETHKEEERKTMTIEELRKSPAYINAYADYIKTGRDDECRALLTENVGATGTLPVPVLVDQIVRTAWDRDEILSRVRRTYFKGNLKVAFERSADPAYVHTEGTTAPTEESLLLGIVTMIPANIKKWIRISDEAAAMGGETFLRYVYDELTYQVIKKLAGAVVGDIAGAGTTNTATAVGVTKITAAPGINTVATAAANLTEEARNTVIIMNRLSEVNFRAAYAAGSFAVDPFMGLPRVYTSALPAYDSASANAVYAIVGDLDGVQVNYPEGDGVVIKYDELTEAEADMVKIVGRQYVAHAVTAPGRFVNIAKPSGT